MTISIEGVLIRSAKSCRRNKDSEYLAYSLEKLSKDLHELYARRDEPGILAEFFGVWSPTEPR